MVTKLILAERIRWVAYSHLFMSEHFLICRFVKMAPPLEEIELAEPPPNSRNVIWRMSGNIWERYQSFANGSSQTSPDEAEGSPLLPNSTNDISSSEGRKKRCRFKFIFGVLVILLLTTITVVHILATSSIMARTFLPPHPQALVSISHRANSSTSSSTTSPPSPQQQQWAANQSLTLLGNYSLGIEKRGHMLSGQLGNVNLCDEPTMKRSFPNLDYALKGYNYLKGFPISLEHDPGFSHQIFQVFFYFFIASSSIPNICHFYTLTNFHA